MTTAAVPLACRLAARGIGVAPDAELALEARRREPRRRACRRSLDAARQGLGDAATRAADLGPGEEPLAADVERDPGRAERAPRSRAAAAFVRTRIAIEPCAVPARARRPDRGRDRGQLGLVRGEPADLGRRTGRAGWPRAASAAAAPSRARARPRPTRPAARTRLANASTSGVER